MKKITLFILTLVTAAFFAACGAPAVNSPVANNANTTNSNTAKPTAAAPTKDALMTLEKTGWEAWKNKDQKVFQDLMSDRYVGFGTSGRVDKAASIKSTTDPKVNVKSYSLSDDQMAMLGNDVAVLTFKGTQDFTQADGKPGPKEVWSSSVYVREGDKWKIRWRNIPDAPAAETPPAAQQPAPPKENTPAGPVKPPDGK